MLKHIPADRKEQLVAEAALLPTSDARVTYPSWYLHRWHFLPDGYLSRSSAALYDHVVRRVYYQGLERTVTRAVLDRLEALQPKSLLEVGCGAGRLLSRIAQREAITDIVGIDLSPYLLERAARRLRGRRVRLVHADGMHVPADEGAFDAVIASHYVGHLPATLRSGAVAELVRVVRPGGHVLVLDHRWHPSPASVHVRELPHSSRDVGAARLRVLERLVEPSSERM
jgi:SAM-dependent methyltransferase